MTFIEQQRRTQIIESAVEVLANEGFAKASLARIATHAGTSKGVLTYHFADKQELIEAVFSRVIERWWEAIRPHVESAPTASTRIEAYIRRQILYIADHPADLIAIGEIGRNHRPDDGTFQFLKQAEAEENELLAGMIREGQESGEFRQCSAETTATAISGSIEGLLRLWAVNRTRDLIRDADELVELFARALRR